MLGRRPDDLRRVLLEPGAELGAPRGFFRGVVEVHAAQSRSRAAPAATSVRAGSAVVLVVPRYPVVVVASPATMGNSPTTGARSTIRPSSVSTPKRSTRSSPAYSIDVDAGRLPSCQVAFGARRRIAVWRTFGDAPARVALRDVLGDEGRRRGRGVDPDGRGAARCHVARRRVHPGVRGRTARKPSPSNRCCCTPRAFPHAPFDAARLGRSRAATRTVLELGGCNWEPGTRYEYHPTSAHWVLAEIIERRDR